MANKFLTLTAVAALSLAPMLALAQSAAPATSSPPAASPVVPDAAHPQAPASEMPNTTSTGPTPTDPPNTTATNTTAPTTPKFVSAQASGQWMGSEIVGTEVVTSTDEALGTISDVVIESDGSVIAAVIDVGGFLGIGAKPVAVSFESLSAAPTSDGEKIVVGLSKEELNSAPEFKTLDQMRAAAPAPATTKTN